MYSLPKAVFAIYYTFTDIKSKATTFEKSSYNTVRKYSENHLAIAKYWNNLYGVTWTPMF